MRLRWPLAAVVCFAWLLTPGCGGGGAAGPLYFVTVVVPGGIYGERDALLRIQGQGFSTGGGARRVHLRASSGTPFEGGTTDTLDLAADLLGDAFVECQVDATHVQVSFTAWVIVVLDDGSTINSMGPILPVTAQKITSVTPGTINASKPEPFVIDGEGFEATASNVATVRFEPLNGALFHAGASRSATLSFPAQIDSDAEVSGATQYMGVLAPTPCRLVVTLSDGTQIRTPDAQPVMVDPGTQGVQGTWTYERPLSTTSGLDYGTITENPIRGAKIQLVRDPSGEVITQRTLDAVGSYLMHYGVEESVIVRVLAETGPEEPAVRVEDNTNGDALYSAEGAPFLIGPGIQTRDYVAGTGWDGVWYSGPRVAAPFAIMDVAYQAMTAFLAERTFQFPTCVLNWSVDNRPSAAYDVTTGEIGGAHFDGNEIYLSGKANVDTDEFDLFVIAHEWGHFFEEKLSRTDTLAGFHGFAFYWLDPTVSFSEGWGTAVAAAVFTPDTVYRDSMGVSQASGWGEDVEDNSLDGGASYPNIGWFSEASVFWLLLDIIDSANEGPHDTVSLGLGPIYDAFVGEQSSTPYHTTIFSFLDELKAANPGAAAGIDTLCQLHGIDAIADAIGTGETNDGGWNENLPIYRTAVINGGSAFATLDNTYDYNWIDSNRRFTFVGNGDAVTVDLLTPNPVTYLDDFDIALTVYHNGEIVGYADDFFDLGEIVSLASTIDGDTYVVLVTDVSPGVAPFTYGVDLLITSP